MYETKRLLLKTPKEIQIEDVLDYYRENKTFLEPFEPKREPDFYTFRQQSIDLYNDVFHFEHGSALKLYIFLKTGGPMIGILNFSQIIGGPFKSCYVGYSLLESKQKHGYMTEALIRGIEIMFEEYGLHRIEGNVMPRNTASIHILINTGFVYEGTARKYLMINGLWEDHEHYVLLNE
ncbi:GNAT family N-acetyltransferase [Acidaminobacter sp. JC074]|uniref:GNAT family N-acetyltransferase n=1 Tax=Acidaminobacter sp. JC074 TaxID=2530199 RepID=UPI001F0EF1CB|nr:GNAT family N-acetyltransferase [Acidaminobacter sp. JC074]MCH4886782.1 GNAT family N-acetyltransferase [Acidaminobacter sp. JC074]